MERVRMTILGAALILTGLACSCTTILPQAVAETASLQEPAVGALAMSQGEKGSPVTGEAREAVPVRQPEQPTSRALGNAPAEGKGQAARGLGNQDDDTIFSDLPRIEIDEEGLKAPHAVGHDALIEQELKRILVLFGDDGAEVPPVFLNEVKVYMRAFQEHPQYRAFVTASLRRSARYMPMARKVPAERNIPEDMAYIAFIEAMESHERRPPCCRHKTEDLRFHARGNPAVHGEERGHGPGYWREFRYTVGEDHRLQRSEQRPFHEAGTEPRPLQGDHGKARGPHGEERLEPYPDRRQVRCEGGGHYAMEQPRVVFHLSQPEIANLPGRKGRMTPSVVFP
jgi:hypothetical protein